MHSIHAAHAAHRTPWNWLESQAPGDPLAVPDATTQVDGNDPAKPNAPARGSDFVQQVIYAQVLTSLHADYRITQPVPVQGLTPADTADQGLAGAASQALAPGGKGAGALRDTVDSGLADAATQLQSLGASASDVAALAESLRSRLESFIGAAGSAQAGATPQESVVAVGASVTQKQKTQLEIVTQEGDTVRLSLRSKTTVAAAGVASSSVDGTASRAAVTVISGSKFQISVDGNLNDQETAAIQDVLKKVEKLADEFFSGDVQGAFAAAADLHIDGSQLASVALDLSLKQRVRAVGFVSQPVSQPAPSVPPSGTSSQTPPPSTLPTQTTPASVPATSPSAAVPVTVPVASGDSQQADAGSTPASTPPTQPSASPDTTITDYLTRLLDSLRDAGNVGDVSVSWKLKLELLLAVTSSKGTPASEPVTAAAPATTPAVDKLGETLKALA